MKNRYQVLKLVRRPNDQRGIGWGKSKEWINQSDRTGMKGRKKPFTASCSIPHGDTLALDARAVSTSFTTLIPRLRQHNRLRLVGVHAAVLRELTEAQSDLHEMCWIADTSGCRVRLCALDVDKVRSAPGCNNEVRRKGK